MRASLSEIHTALVLKWRDGVVGGSSCVGLGLGQ